MTSQTDSLFLMAAVGEISIRELRVFAEFKVMGLMVSRWGIEITRIKK